MFWENFLANSLSSITAGIILWFLGRFVYKKFYKNKINKKIETYINTISQNITEQNNKINYNYCNIEKVEHSINKTEQYSIEKTGRTSTDEENKNLKFEIKN